MAEFLQYRSAEKQQRHSAQLGIELTPLGLSTNRYRLAKTTHNNPKKIHKIDVILDALH